MGKLLAILFIVIGSQAAQANLITNGGFESRGFGWQNFGNSTIVSSNVHSGTYALKVGIGQGGRYQMLNSMVPRAYYSLEVVGKLLEASDVCEIGVSFKDSSGRDLQVSKVQINTYSWADPNRFKRVNFQAPASFSQVQMFIWKAAGSGYCLVDDIKVVAIGSVPQVPTPTPRPATPTPVPATPTPEPQSKIRAEGFGQTPGGTGKPVYRVVNLNNSGPGSLRDALSAGNRYIHFDVSGTIRLSSAIDVRGSYITVDGSTAPGEGITITGAGITLAGSLGAHNIIIHNLRIRDIAGEEDAITIWDGAHHILIDHVSVSKASDGAIDITEGAYNVTVQWTLMQETLTGGKATLISYGEPRNLTMHHNAYIKNGERLPLVWACRATDGSRTCNQTSSTTLDFRNNLVYGFTSSGASVGMGAHVNFVNNYFSAPGNTSFKQGYRAIWADSDTPTHASGNISGDNISEDINSVSIPNRVSVPYSFAAVETQSACAASRLTLSSAGAMPRDSIDRAYVESVRLNCN